ncbi:transglycosylase SLT domain-containing protein [Nocardia spumae]|uniref:aggregation-promoting factor C-terminal-like domain-containing protein n=1 Tax=Nocardia spumae TaxID=2887190 RepID=UPI001D143AC3|nr:transglycosylase SLT domain-containing protein [Nocardia spumae]
MTETTSKAAGRRVAALAAICALWLAVATLALATTAGADPADAADCGPACVDTSTGSASGSASGSAGSSGSAAAGLLLGLPMRTVALTIVPAPQFPSFDQVITHESSWNPFAINPESGAYGLGQALPPEKMASHGADWMFNPVTQIRWTYDYMVERYGSPDGAWAFWQSHHWY